MFDRATQIRAVDLCHRLRPVVGTEDLAADIIDAYQASDAVRLAEALDRAELYVVPAQREEGRRPGLPPADQVDRVARIAAQMGVAVAQGRIPPARQRAHTRALLGALGDAEAVAFAVTAADVAIADVY